VTGCLARLLADLESDLTLYELAPRIGLLGPTFDEDEQKMLLDALVSRLARDSDMSNVTRIRPQNVNAIELVAA
jgi:hypothetical protein